MSDHYTALSALIGGAAGALDKIDGAGLSDGDAATVVLSSGVYHYHLNASSGASENSPYVIAPDSNPGTKRWILVTPQAPFSHVFATESVTSLITGAWTTLVNPTEVRDVLSEYNNSTGVFTAKYDGYYQVNFCSQLTSAAWSDNQALIHKIQVESADVVKGPNVTTQAAVTFSAIVLTSATIKMSAGEELECFAYQNSGNTIALNGTIYNWLTIDRIA